VRRTTLCRGANRFWLKSFRTREEKGTIQKGCRGLSSERPADTCQIFLGEKKDEGLFKLEKRERKPKRKKENYSVEQVTNQSDGDQDSINPMQLEGRGGGEVYGPNLIALAKKEL